MGHASSLYSLILSNTANVSILSVPGKNKKHRTNLRTQNLLSNSDMQSLLKAENPQLKYTSFRNLLVFSVGWPRAATSAGANPFRGGSTTQTSVPATRHAGCTQSITILAIDTVHMRDLICLSNRNFTAPSKNVSGRDSAGATMYSIATALPSLCSRAACACRNTCLPCGEISMHLTALQPLVAAKDRPACKLTQTIRFLQFCLQLFSGKLSHLSHRLPHANPPRLHLWAQLPGDPAAPCS